jgi:streptomycin 6-kinase
VRLPAALEWWRDRPGGAEWLDSLPRLAAECAERWSLTLGAPFEGGNVSLPLAVELVDGSEAVLKLNFPEAENEHEAVALEHWRGRGAVRLLAEDRERSALLLERCRPGNQLWSLPEGDGVYEIAAGVLKRLWRPPPMPSPFRLLADEAGSWAEELPARWRASGGAVEQSLVDMAVASVAELVPSQGAPAVLHQDFHGGNVLRAQRESWLAIDPKPLVGEPAFDAASLLRDRRWELSIPGAAGRLRRRLDVLADALDLDRERMRLWGIVHALAWGVSGTKVEADMIECARLLAAAH